MDIKSLNTSLAGAKATEGAKNTDRATPSNNQVTADSKATDKVTLTNFSSQIAELEKKVLNSSNDNESRIAELKKSIASGEYQVDSQKVAGKLLEAEIFFSKV